MPVEETVTDEPTSFADYFNDKLEAKGLSDLGDPKEVPPVDDKPVDELVDDKPADAVVPDPDEKPVDTPKDKPADDKPEEVDIPSFEDLADPEAEPKAKEEPEDEDVPEDVKAAGDKAVETWSTLKKDLKTAQAELAEVKSKGAEDGDPKEIAELKAKIEEQDNLIAATNVTKSAKYQESITAPLNALEVRARNLDKDPERQREIITALLEVDDDTRAEKLSELGETMVSFKSGELFDIAREMDQVYAKRDNIVANASDAAAEIQQAELANQGKESAERTAARKQVAARSWDHLVKNIPGMVDDNGKLLPAYESVKEAVLETDITQMKDSTAAYSIASAHILPAMMKESATKSSRISELEATVKSMTAAGPGGGGSSNGDAPEAEDQSGGGFIEAMSKKSGLFGGR